jgi:lysophospholipase L1-like esterase
MSRAKIELSIRKWRKPLAAHVSGFPHPVKRTDFRAISLLPALLFALLIPAPASAVQSSGQTEPAWVATWGTAMMQADSGHGVDLTGQTLRLIIHSSVGGERARIWLSNRFGSVPLEIGAAHLALSAYADPLTAPDGSAIRAESDRALTFDGSASVTIPPGATIASDAVALRVPPLSDLAVSLYFPKPTEATTLHTGAQQISLAANGDLTAASSLSDRAWQERSWYVLTGVDVDAPGASAVVALGDSITDGNHSTQNANRRWPDDLAARLQAHGPTRAAGILGVVNAGISGNRVLLDGTGPNALARLDADVLDRSGVRFLILFHGINDIEAVTRSHQPYGDLEKRLEWALAQIATRAHDRGITVFGATQMPDCRNLQCASPEGEAMRQALNQWIRTAPVFDGVIDFDRITRDPEHPSQLLPAYDSGDGVHPNDAGYAAMADGIDLNLFTTKRRLTEPGGAH